MKLLFHDIINIKDVVLQTCNAYELLHNCRLLLQCKWDLRSSAMFCSTDLQLPTFQDNLSVPSSRVILSWNVCNKLPVMCNISEEWNSHTMYTVFIVTEINREKMLQFTIYLNSLSSNWLFLKAVCIYCLYCVARYEKLNDFG